MSRSSPRREPVEGSRPAPVDGRTPGRVVIEGVEPEIGHGQFAVKRVVGDDILVSADIFADGHDRLAALLRWRFVGLRDPRETADQANREAWTEVPMQELGNDRWSARFRVDRQGYYEYTIQAWIDRFASWRHELSKKFAAGDEVTSELLEGAALLRDAAGRLAKGAMSGVGSTGAIGAGASSFQDAFATADDASGDLAWLARTADALARPGDMAARVAAALSTDLLDAMRRLDARDGAIAYAPRVRVWVDRERARFGAWYEMFPRSAGPDPTRSATFEEAAGRLREIAAMGFDVLYLPPIHPIGVTARKGRHNTPAAHPGDPGSPWAIGSSAGGHDSVEPGLGTLADFDRFARAAKAEGLEIALDLALQCSPDHPYVRDHPEWFRHRPDGTIKYAENPPKKYQDIYPLDLTSTSRAVWEELKRLVLFWIDRGVRIFRVDNPHTKPLRFWAWLIGEVRAIHPDVIFLSEAFTRPKVMKYLAKVGFTQSYTYFTWRNTKAELTEYFTELTQTDMREYFRPNLFTNTPDILHAYLQNGGRPAFEVRLLLAATLGASYGIYSGFELCENRGIPGTEEYLWSEKYQYRQWDWDRPGHIKDLIRSVNRIRRENAALQRDASLRFHQTDNDQVIGYSKQTPDLANVVLVVVNLDPVYMQHGWIRVPIADWGLPADGAYEVHDLLSDERYFWQREWNYVRLDPGVRPGHILRVERR